MKQFLAWLVAVVAIVSFTQVATTLPAQAASTPCAAARVCTYWDVQAGDPMYYYTGPINSCIEIGEPWDNDISSAKNTFSTAKVTFYHEHGCQGGSCTIGPGGGKNFLLPFCVNDSSSSLKIRPV